MLNPLRATYVKQQVDAFEYIQRTVHLRRVGLLYQGRCPFHQERTASFTVYPQGYRDNPHGSWYCFGCGKGGDVIEFKRCLDDLPNRQEAVLRLEAEHGIDADDEEVRHHLLVEQLALMQVGRAHLLELGEVALVCAHLTRSYLRWVQAEHPDRVAAELAWAQTLYAYLDEQLLERTTVEAAGLVGELELRLAHRRRGHAGLS